MSLHERQLRLHSQNAKFPSIALISCVEVIINFKKDEKLQRKPCYVNYVG